MPLKDARVGWPTPAPRLGCVQLKLMDECRIFHLVDDGIPVEVCRWNMKLAVGLVHFEPFVFAKDILGDVQDQDGAALDPIADSERSVRHEYPRVLVAGEVRPRAVAKAAFPDGLSGIGSVVDAHGSPKRESDADYSVGVAGLLFTNRSELMKIPASSVEAYGVSTVTHNPLIGFVIPVDGVSRSAPLCREIKSARRTLAERFEIA